MTQTKIVTAAPSQREFEGAVSRMVLAAMDLLDADKEGASRLLNRAADMIRAPLRAADISIRQCALAVWQERKAVAYIDEHLSTRIEIKQLAATCRLSASYFSRAFKGSFGSCPQAFILRRRVAFTQQTMLATSEPLSQVALLAGFADQAHFSRVFRRSVGMTPNAWRRRNLTVAVGQAVLN